jgi:hypothetical protein
LRLAEQLLQTSLQCGAASDVLFIALISHEMLDYLDGKCKLFFQEIKSPESY